MIAKAFVQALEVPWKVNCLGQAPVGNASNSYLANVFFFHTDEKKRQRTATRITFLIDEFIFGIHISFAAVSSNSSWKLVCLLHNLNLLFYLLGSDVNASVTRIESESDVGQSKFTFLLKCVQGHNHQIKPLNVLFLGVFSQCLSHAFIKWYRVKNSSFKPNNKPNRKTNMKRKTHTENGQTFFMINKRCTGIHWNSEIGLNEQSSNLFTLHFRFGLDSFTFL